MQPFEQDWDFIRAAVDELESYLLSTTLYWPVPGTPARSPSGSVPRLTIGNLLLSLKRLSAADWSDERAQELERLQQKIGDVRKRWRAHWEKKASEEYFSRLPRWQQFVIEMGGATPPSRQEYAYQVRLRVILDLLADDIGEAPDVRQSPLSNLDQVLRRRLESDGFIWDDRLRAEFPEDRFWYLYGVPQAK
ncbi:MAG TPA: hypothetical protein VFF68_08415 [Anaerolineaceae bacterium]|nr:hypothetical protein [Anaerolineaceae bacterium]